MYVIYGLFITILYQLGQQMRLVTIVSLCSNMLISCASSVVANPPLVGEFTLNEISGQGCGMTLWKPHSSNKNRFVFFNGIGNNSMEMKINGRITKFSRIKASGQKFYGQQTLQTFRSQDGKTQVDVAVKLGLKGEIESLMIEESTIRVKQNGQEVKIIVVGDAGC